MCRTCDHNTRRWLISLDTAQLIHKLGPTTSNTDDIFDKHSLDRICSQDKKAPDTGKMSIRQELRSILRLCEFKAFLDSETPKRNLFLLLLRRRGCLIIFWLIFQSVRSCSFFRTSMKRQMVGLVQPMCHPLKRLEDLSRLSRGQDVRYYFCTLMGLYNIYYLSMRAYYPNNMLM